MAMKSIRGRLMALLLPALLLITLAAAASGYLAASRRLGGFLDAQLAESARVLLLWVLAEPRAGDEADPTSIDRELVELFAAPAGAPGDDEARPLHEPRASLAWFFERPGVVGGVSSSPVLDRAGACGQMGLTVVSSERGAWRVYTTVGGDPPATVCVGQPLSARRALIVRMLLPSLGWWLLVLPLTAAIVFYALRFGLAPLQAAVADLRGRAPGDLMPVPAHDDTRELQPLMAAMNDLLARQRRLLAQERRFSAEAAHELRTPLTTVRLRAEQALLGAERPGEGETERRALQAIVSETNRAERVLSQLLALARVDAVDAGGLRGEQVRLMPLLRELLAEQATFGMRREVQLRLLAAHETLGGRGAPLDEGRAAPLDDKGRRRPVPDAAAPEPVVTGDPILLQILLRNLVDNGLRYTPAGGHVDVAVHGGGSAPVSISVVDSGPGIAPEVLARLGEPFERGTRHDESGTGLGLTIARRIARLHGARLELANAGAAGGLRATVRFSH